MYKAYIGSDMKQRLAWLSGEAASSSLFERRQIILCSGREAIENMFVPGRDMLVANGFKNNNPVDICGEFFFSSGSLEEAGGRCSDAVIPDANISMVKDPFWLTSSKIILGSLYRGASQYWGNLHRALPAQEVPSLTSVLFRFVTELLVAKMSSASFEKKKFDAPVWWNCLPREDMEILNGIVGNNAGSTVGCIFGEFYTSLNPFRKWMPKLKCDSVLQNQRRVFVYTPSVSSEFLGAFLDAAGYAWKSFDILAFELNLFTNREISVISRFLNGGGLNRGGNFCWTGSDLVLHDATDFLSGDVIFGSSQSGRVVQKFKSLVMEYTGSQSGLLVTPTLRGDVRDGAEDPGFLRWKNAFSLESGKWYLQEMPEAGSGKSFVLEEDPSVRNDDMFSGLKELIASGGGGEGAPEETGSRLGDERQEYLGDLLGRIRRNIDEDEDEEELRELCSEYIYNFEKDIRSELVEAAANTAYPLRSLALDLNIFLSQISDNPDVSAVYDRMESFGENDEFMCGDDMEDLSGFDEIPGESIFPEESFSEGDIRSYREDSPFSQGSDKIFNPDGTLQEMPEEKEREGDPRAGEGDL